MRTAEEIKKRLEEARKNRDSGLFWSGHIDGEIFALEWVLEG